MTHSVSAARRTKARRLCADAVVLLAVLTAPARAIGQSADASPSPTLEEYRIQIGDQLDIKFFYNPTLNEQVTVRPDGRFSLQLIQEVQAVGLTPAALTQALTDRYAVDLKQPQVTVIVRGFSAQRVFVDGEVGKPGMIPIVGLTTALQAIAEAGGLKETARESEVIVIRRGEINQPTTLRVNLKKARNGRSLGDDVRLAPYDIVFVPRSRMSNVNVWMDQYLRKNIPIPFSLQYGIFR
jgi:polysaccharide export outer membrane protein